MIDWKASLAGCMALLVLAVARAAGAEPPAWAYAIDPPAKAPAPAPDGRVPQKLPGSSVTFTQSQLKDLFKAPDWYPADHPAMPAVVAAGRKPAVYACAYCHLPNGQGRPENAALAGLPVAYITQQVSDVRKGLRTSSVPASQPHVFMKATVTAATDAEVRAAAEYFSRLKFRPWVRVVEARTVPKTRVAGYMLKPLPGGATEPIGTRIIEVPADVARTELRDPRSGFVAYVPVGSIAKGEALVTKGGAGRTLPCATCHGPDLRGFAVGPPIAGRSPSYIVRQLIDIQGGARHGVTSTLMKPVVAKLALEDIIAIAAYVSSRPP
jgi:cytochrome c553